MSEVKIGFEFEFLSSMEPGPAYRSVKRYLGLTDMVSTFVDGYQFNRRQDYSKWAFTSDGSLEGEYHDNDYEIVSSVLDYNEGIEAMKKMFAWMRRHRVTTNRSCGFHVNISLPVEKLRQLNQFKLVTLLDEHKQLKKFNREGNEYCIPHLMGESPDGDEVGSDIVDSLINSLNLYRENTEDPWGDNILVPSRASVKKIMELSSTLRLDNEKYRTVNFGKLGANTPYLEFRIMGGNDYHKRTREIIASIDHFVSCMKAACKANAKLKEFRAALKPFREHLLEKAEHHY